MIAIIFVIFFAFVLLAFPLAIAIVFSQKRAKKRAYALLAGEQPKKGETNKLIRTLNTARDAEAKELIRKLMAL